jgi:predicted alpha/beta superfamily hydrolase/thioredoxin-like negative regulator of GroEL
MMKIRRIHFFQVLLLNLIFFMASFYLFSQQDGEDVVIGKYRVIRSKILNEDRSLLVHLPRDYEGDERHYPVIYMLYGNHVTTYFAEAVSVLDTLGPTGRIPNCILVGIMNTNRYRDLLPQTPDGKPTGIENFTRFLEEEVFPFIDKNYRTKDYRILIGPQAGANFGLYTLFENPDLFNACIINHPFRWQGGRDLILKTAENFFNKNPEFKKFVFITYDDSDTLAKEGIGYINRFSEMIRIRNPKGFSLVLNFIPGNDEFLQRLGLREGLKKLFESYPFPEKRPVEKLDDILAFYRELSQEYGFEAEPPELVLTVQGDGLMERGKVREVIEILKYTMERYPRAANSYIRMANILMENGDLENARDYLQKTVERVPHDSGMLRSRLVALEKRIAGSAAYRVEKAIRSAGIDEGIRTFREMKAESQSPFYFDENEFNELRYRLMQSGKMTEALEIFKLNVELYPESANVYASLGEVYMIMGKTEKARKFYKKALELDPGRTSAKEKLKKLEEK